MNSHFPFCLCPARSLLSPRATRALHARPTPKRDTPPLPAAAAAAGALLAPGTLGPLFGFRPPPTPARAPRRLPLPLTMDDAPPLRRSVRARNAPSPPRIYTLADLDLDCLALVLSLVQDEHVRDRCHSHHNPIILVMDCKARFRAPPLACKALAAAATGPSVAWQNLAFSANGNRPAGISSFFSALQRVATSVRRLQLQPGGYARDIHDFIAALLPALEAVAPHL